MNGHDSLQKRTSWMMTGAVITNSANALYAVLFFPVRADDQVVSHGKNIGNAAGPDIRKIFIGFRVDRAFECHVPIFDDDVNGRERRHSVPRQSSIAIECTEHSAADAIVHR